MLNPFIQLFADDEPAAGTPEQPATTGKTFSEDYVKALRQESAGYRTRAQAQDAVLRDLLGVPQGEEMGDINARVAAYRSARAAEMAKASNRLIDAEIRTLSGYDTKLLSRLIDRSGLKIDDKGTVTGLKEAVAAVEKEFPSVRTSAPGRHYAPTNGAEPTQTSSRMNDLIRSAFR